jgi:YHS domain-containing protein
MNKLIIIFIFSVLLLVFINCSGEKKTDTGTQEVQQTQTTVADTGKAKCPGCGMVMAKTEMVRYEADGKTMYFCSEHCKDNYLASVEKKTDTLPPSPQ